MKFILHPSVFWPCYFLTAGTMLMMVFWHDGNLIKMFKRKITPKELFDFGFKILVAILIVAVISLFWFIFMPVFVSITCFQYASSLAVTEEPVVEEPTITPTPPVEKGPKKKHF